MKEIVGKPQTIKLLNKDIIEEIIKTKGPITKPEISKITNLSLVTVNKTVDMLLEENRVKLSGINQSTGGRRAQLFEINGDIAYIIGLYYYKNVYIGAVSNVIGEIKYKEEFKVRSDLYDEVMEDIYYAIDKLIDKCEGLDIRVIGIGLPGVVKEGVVTNIPNIASLEGINVKKILEERYKTEVILENDINITTMGVYYSHYKEKFDNLSLVYLEQGIGSGLILNRELYKGSTNFAGELSYLIVNDYVKSIEKSAKYKGNFENNISIINESIDNSTKENKEKLKGILLKTIVDALIGLICIINPEIIAIKNSRITDEDAKYIESVIGEFIDKDNVPKVIKLTNFREHSIQGVINMCIKEKMQGYSLSSINGG